VGYGDLNLRAAEGEETLMRRVKGAVRFVCREPGELSSYSVTSACRKGAWKGAQPQIAQAIAQARANPTLALSGAVSVRASR
jgi:UrcA family protein